MKKLIALALAGTIALGACGAPPQGTEKFAGNATRFCKTHVRGHNEEVWDAYCRGNLADGEYYAKDLEVFVSTEVGTQKALTEK